MIHRPLGGGIPTPRNHYDQIPQRYTAASIAIVAATTSPTERRPSPGPVRRRFGVKVATGTDERTALPVGGRAPVPLRPERIRRRREKPPYLGVGYRGT